MNNLTELREKRRLEDRGCTLSENHYRNLIDKDSSIQFLQQSSEYLGMKLTPETLIRRYILN